MKITLPELSLVVLIGCSGSGKSTFARKHFKASEILSSDFCRGLVSNDENSLDATADAFDVLRYIGTKRLTRGLLTVIDATNVQADARKGSIALAREHDVLPVAIVLNLGEKICVERNRQRPDRTFGSHVIRNQNISLRRSMRALKREGFRHIFELESIEEIEAVTIERQPLWNNKRDERGPFDIIGDVHGCFDELCELLVKLGYEIQSPTTVIPPKGRKAVFVGDLVDRGPNVPAVLKLAMAMVAAGHAYCVPGNHDIKLMRKLYGRDVQIAHGLAESLQQLESEPPEFLTQTADFIDSLVSHYVFDDGRLVVAHAGMKEQYQGRGSRRVREFALYGETTGETDEFGLPVRLNWAAEYRGKPHVVYGHTPVLEADWLNRTLNIDTGCVFGGKLTALRWPEKEIISVAAKQTYAQPARPIGSSGQSPLSAQQELDDVLDIDDVLGKRIIATRLMQNVTVREENSIAALEIMSRFAANPKWLIYLPPTMSPSETTAEPGLLEHPKEVFGYFRNHGVSQVVCEQKHMGSRAVIILCRNEESANKRFGVLNEGNGIIYTRTGRRFFEDRAVEQALLKQFSDAVDSANFWNEFNSDWFCFDCELMPWSAKAQELLKNQYAAVGSSATAGLRAANAALEQAARRAEYGGDALMADLIGQYHERRESVQKYITAYRHYCWAVHSVNDLRIAPFHLLASEGKAHFDKDHVWHMQTLARLCQTGAAPSLMATPYHVVSTDADGELSATRWWEELTAANGEGMVVKPLDFVVRGTKGLIQPAIKCRGKEYLRIIYGPEYSRPEHLDRLRSRGVNAKRALALREFALGVESVERFVQREPLRRVHECAFGVLALESEPVDPRLQAAHDLPLAKQCGLRLGAVR